MGCYKLPGFSFILFGLGVVTALGYGHMDFFFLCQRRCYDLMEDHLITGRDLV